jgi:hypothetical protein
MPWSGTPADLSVLPFGRLDIAFHAGYGVGSAMFPLSGLNPTACALPVYASCPRVTPWPRKTRFR